MLDHFGICFGVDPAFFTDMVRKDSEKGADDDTEGREIKRCVHKLKVQPHTGTTEDSKVIWSTESKLLE